jgi:hypothetical protein
MKRPSTEHGKVRILMKDGKWTHEVSLEEREQLLAKVPPGEQKRNGVGLATPQKNRQQRRIFVQPWHVSKLF